MLMSTGPATPRSRAGVVLINGANEVALIERRRGDSVYFTLPGGGIEEGETPADAAAREAMEELGVHVKLGGLVAEILHGDVWQYYFLATINSGAFGTGRPGSRSAAEAGTYQAVWKPVTDLPALDVRPRALVGILSAISSQGWPT